MRVLDEYYDRWNAGSGQFNIRRSLVHCWTVNQMKIKSEYDKEISFVNHSLYFVTAKCHVMPVNSKA